MTEGNDNTATNRDPLVDAVLSASYRVAITLGHGFLESVYEAALMEEFAERGVCFERQCLLAVNYNRKQVGTFRADFLVEGRLVVELKAVSQLAPEHYLQVLNYLRATDFEIGLLLNFGTPTLRWRVVKNPILRKS